MDRDDKLKSGHDADFDTDVDEEEEDEDEEKEEEEGEDHHEEDHEDVGAEDEDEDASSLPLFRPFTAESLKRIAKRIEKATAAAAAEKNQSKEDGAAQPDDLGATATTVAAFEYKGPPTRPSGADAAGEDKEEPCPDPQFEAGKPLPPKYGDFPVELYGRPIEDLDEFYHNKYVSIRRLGYGVV